MTPQERKNLAEQIATNPLTEILLDEIEKNAIEALIAAKTETDRLERQSDVRAARAFRTRLTQSLSNWERRGAPA